MPTLTASAEPILAALTTAEERSLLPTQMGSADLAKLGSGLWKQAFFSARTGNAEYLSALKGLVERYIKGGYKNDLGQLRVEARALLKQLGYNPLTGFPEDFGSVPEAEPGSLQDLSSEKRLNLIFETQARLARGLTQQAQGLARADAFPAWELDRMYARRKPRGSVKNGSPGWETRWVQCGGHLINDRMIALKTDPIWAALGSRENFPDALDVDHPPFAFNSGYGWKRELSRAQCVEIGLISADEKPEEGRVAPSVTGLSTTAGDILAAAQRTEADERWTSSHRIAEIAQKIGASREQMHAALRELADKDLVFTSHFDDPSALTQADRHYQMPAPGDARDLIILTDEGKAMRAIKPEAPPALPKKLDAQTRLALLDKLNEGSKGFSLEQLKAAIRARRTAGASNDASATGSITDLMLLACAINALGRRAA